MKPRIQFELCMAAAKAIVASYRAEAPAGCDPQNSELWVAGIGVAVSAAGTAYGAYSQNKAQKAQQAAMTKANGGAGGSGGGRIDLGEKPVAAEYHPVDFSKEQWKAVSANLSNLTGITDLMNHTNANIDADTLRRATKFIPNYQENMRLQGEAAHSLLSGHLPYDDALDVVAGRGEIGNALGIPGTSAPATFRDLGIKQLEGLNMGSGLMKGMVDIAETVNPVGRRMRPQDMFVNPTDRIRMAMEQNQLIQQSDQNRNNIEAGISPTDSAAAQIAMARQTGALGGGGTHASQDYSGYAQAAGQLFMQAGSLYRDYKTPSGTNVGSFAVNPSSGVQNRIYRPIVADSSGVLAPSRSTSIPAR